MENITQVLVNKILKYGASKDKNTAWIDFKVNEENVLRFAFPVEFQFDLKLSLQLLQMHISEERKKAGLPVIEQTYVVNVKNHEFARDDINQIALIRTRYENGASTDTPFDKTQISQTIEFLKTALEVFENQSKNPNH